MIINHLIYSAYIIRTVLIMSYLINIPHIQVQENTHKDGQHDSCENYED